MANETRSPAVSDLEAIIKQPDQTNRLVRSAEALGRELARADLTKSQIRNIYATVKMIAAKRDFDKSPKSRGQIDLLVPKLHYAAARQPALKRLAETLSQCIRMLEGKQEYFDRFSDFFEAIVAYHYSFRAQADLDKRSGGR